MIPQRKPHKASWDPGVKPRSDPRSLPPVPPAPACPPTHVNVRTCAHAHASKGRRWETRGSLDSSFLLGVVGWRGSETSWVNVRGWCVGTEVVGKIDGEVVGSEMVGGTDGDVVGVGWLVRLTAKPRRKCEAVFDLLGTTRNTASAFLVERERKQSLRRGGRQPVG